MITTKNTKKLGEADRTRISRSINDWALKVEPMTEAIKKIYRFESLENWEKTKRLDVARQVILGQSEGMHRVLR